MSGRMAIGFSQRIRLEWLEKTGQLVLAGSPREEIEGELQSLLREKLSVGGTGQRGNRGKAITILLKIWVSPPKNVQALHSDGLALLKRVPVADHLAVHWGMTMAVYPFLGRVAGQVGRLLRLQSSFTLAQIQRRIREQLGERETVARAARKILRVFLDWGVLKKGETKGVYQGIATRPIHSKRLAAWLVEAAMISSGLSSVSLKTVIQSPSLFPFKLGLSNINELNLNERLEPYRQGLDEDIIMLRGK